MIDAKVFEMPGMSDRMSSSNAMSDYTIKYFKADLDDLEDLSMLQEIETNAIRSPNVIVLTRDKFTFMERYFMVISYAEKNA